MKKVFLIPGFTASDLGIVSTGTKIWWDPAVTAIVGLDTMALEPDGVTPLPPNGQVLGIFNPAQNPWPSILSMLRIQLDGTGYSIEVDSYDWRLDLLGTAANFANLVRNNATAAEPATLVGHSAGGLVALAAWVFLGQTGQQDLVRRIITICSPFQGSYGPIEWLTGVSPTIRQLLAIEQLAGPFSGVNPLKWTLTFLNEVALTWPSFYELFPGLGGTEEKADPNRALLYTSANYPIGLNPSSKWLDYSKNVWQPFITGPDSFPPSWVMTTVAGYSLETAEKLPTSAIPLVLNPLTTTEEGDSVVTAESALRLPGAQHYVAGSHSSVPLGIARSGLLAALILDPRGPITPPPPPVVEPGSISANVTDPPNSDWITGLQCIGGG